MWDPTDLEFLIKRTVLIIFQDTQFIVHQEFSLKMSKLWTLDDLTKLIRQLNTIGSCLFIIVIFRVSGCGRTLFQNQGLSIDTESSSSEGF